MKKRRLFFRDTDTKIHAYGDAKQITFRDQNSDDDGAIGFRQRKLEVFVEGGFGKFSLGHGDTASNGTSEVDGFQDTNALLVGARVRFYSEDIGVS